VERIYLWLAPAAAFAIVVIAPGAASTPRVDNIVQVGGRVTSFMQPRLTGVIIAAIIYEPGNAASENEARSIERSMGEGMVVGSARLVPRRVSTSALQGLAGARLAFVTRGTNYRAIASVAASRSILTISADPACARAGYCVVAISAAPRIQITVSRAASRAANLRFNSSFLMLVREI
jgi:hypothetical protein